ncbi:translation initiation factor IF-2 [Candidatus Woesearchaeota archaeon]|nr:translation initiation factor IF-2 [Candidatus Woesearchaeota archaeon]
MVTRSLIVSVLGHVDHGKSSILDRIRGSAIAAGEAGGITQAIGASIIPLSVLTKVCGDLLKATKKEFTIPGLLFIDTPGHAAFTNLRKRGGALADIAVLVIDVTEGLMPQTLEVLEILRNDKVPFIIAANKVDKISGWTKYPGPILQSISKQTKEVQALLDKKIYDLVGKLYDMGMGAERFDRVEDYTKQLAIIPCSAVTEEGIPEIIMVLMGLSQKYIQQGLNIQVEGPGRGVILEVKETKGLGKSMDVILFDGTLKVYDTIVIGGLNEPIIAKIRALFQPADLEEMRAKKAKFVPVKEVHAATGVRIGAPHMEGVVAGMPLMSATEDTIEEAKVAVQEQVEEVLIETEEDGLILKADTLGSLEALITMFNEKNFFIRKATIGNITRKDVMEAVSNKNIDPLLGIILGFNIEPESPEVVEYAREQGITIICKEVIYHLLQDYEKWMDAEKKKLEAKKLDALIKPCKIQLMKGYMFRQSNPAVVGVDVLAGTLRPGIALMKMDGSSVTTVQQVQKDQKSVPEAVRGDQVAVALPGVTIGRQLHEEDVLICDLPEDDFKKYKELKEFLVPETKELLKEIADIKRKQNPVWGV